MSSYIVIEFLFLLCLVLYEWSKKKYFGVKVIILSSILFVFIISNLKSFIPIYQETYYEDIKRIGEELKNKTDENSQIFVIMKDASFPYLLPYYLDFRILDSSFYDFYGRINEYKKNEVLENLFLDDYLYINEIPQNFIEEYKEFFETPILPKTLYKINKKERKLKIYE